MRGAENASRSLQYGIYLWLRKGLHRSSLASLNNQRNVDPHTHQVEPAFTTCLDHLKTIRPGEVIRIGE
jgi:hypothetical protein